MNLVLQSGILLDQDLEELRAKDLLLEARGGSDTLTTTDETDDFLDVGAELENLSQENLSEESSDSCQEDGLACIEFDNLRLSPWNSNVHFGSRVRTNSRGHITPSKSSRSHHKSMEAE